MKDELIRIMLVDDHPLVRESWKLLLENNPRFEIVADYSNGAEALENIPSLKPDILLVDINMAPLDGFAVTKSVNTMMPEIKIIGLSVHNQPKYATRLLQLGARGFLTKTSSLEEINHGILAVHQGKVYICDEIKRNMPPAG
ncbi:MAG TPA: response regulator transcription factor [Chitinophagaceae bacterium]|nr:response regulator transcription factor [Chitinophagaceae bacterium]HPH33780.1 response regulator transcription factor [Chitinophagaceae bacterium]HPN59157.1 response regulator transcription factor [Chitinophagaceae bacterium]